MDSDNKDKIIYWIQTTRIRLFKEFEQQRRDYLMDLDNKDKTI